MQFYYVLRLSYGGRRVNPLLSYNDDPHIRRLYRARGVRMRDVQFRYSVAKDAPRKIGHELLIANYPIEVPR